METQKSNDLMLTERDKYHERIMVNILKSLSDTPLVLKGGTALYLGYGLNRFSEDLDFDSPKKLNLLNKIKDSAPYDIIIDGINVKKDTDTVSRYIVNYHVRNTNINDVLKIEVSYRTPTPAEQITVRDGIRFSSVERIIDNKLKAAYDGDNTRTKGRDLFDLHFLAIHFPEKFTFELAQRLQDFAQDPDKLVSLYREDIEADPLLNKKMDIEQMALELNETANHIYLTKKMENNPMVQAMSTEYKNSFQEFLTAATNTKENVEEKTELSSALKLKM